MNYTVTEPIRFEPILAVKVDLKPTILVLIDELAIKKLQLTSIHGTKNNNTTVANLGRFDLKSSKNELLC